MHRSFLQPTISFLNFLFLCVYVCMYHVYNMCVCACTGVCPNIDGGQNLPPCSMAGSLVCCQVLQSSWPHPGFQEFSSLPSISQQECWDCKLAPPRPASCEYRGPEHSPHAVCHVLYPRSHPRSPHTSNHLWAVLGVII